MIIELLNPCHFTHLITKGHIFAKPSHLIILRFYKFFIILKFHVIIDLGLPCQLNHYTQLKITKDTLIDR
jgi:hypothetical protein